jgi:hypothetical protein
LIQIDAVVEGIVQALDLYSEKVYVARGGNLNAVKYLCEHTHED